MRIGNLSLQLSPLLQSHFPAPIPQLFLQIQSSLSSNIPSSVTQNLTPNFQQQSCLYVDRILMQQCIFLSKEEKEKNPMHIVQKSNSISCKPNIKQGHFCVILKIALNYSCKQNNLKILMYQKYHEMFPFCPDSGDKI